MSTYFGSARHDENGKLTGGKKGDQLQNSTPDYSGECSQQKAYKHNKGWIIERPIQGYLAKRLAQSMITLCDNKHVGYNQVTRNVIDINTTIDCGIDCSSAVRSCIIAAGLKDTGNFTTANEVAALEATGEYVRVAFTSILNLYEGDILVTKTKGHTVIVTKGKLRTGTALKIPSGSPVIKKGSKGDRVSQLQFALNDIAGQGLAVDGIAGTKTVQAIKNIQTLCKITVDGIYGKGTASALKSLAMIQGKQVI